MKAVATALVLIAGAAVVLWYGNTLNSWILGGLIGGLAALLLSIPISLTVFSYLSRRHDEQLRAEVQEEMQLAQMHEYTHAAARVPQRAMLIEEYASEDEDGREPEQASRRQFSPARAYEPRPQTHHLPVPASSMEVQKIETGRQSLIYGNSTYIPDGAYQQRPTPPVRGKEGTDKRTTRKIEYPGFHGYQPGSRRGQLQAAALREARREAIQDDGVDDEQSARTTRRLASNPLNAIIEEQRSRSKQQQTQHGTRRQAMQQTRRIIDAPARSANSQRLLPQGQTPTRTPRSEPQTDYLQGQSMHQTDLHAAQLMRNTHIQAQSSVEETGPIQHTLLRRAPYLYEDDPLRQQLAQQLDSTPPVRRSSRRPMPEEE